MKTLFTLLLLLGVVTLQAQERSGPYLSFGYGSALYSDDSRFSYQDDETAILYRLSAGAYMNRSFSVEIDYTKLENYESRYANGDMSDEAYALLSVSVAIHGSAFENKMDLFAKMGAGEVTWDEKRDTISRDSSGGALVFGVGAGYRFNENLMFKAGYDRYDFTLTESDAKYRMHLDVFYGALEVQF